MDFLHRNAPQQPHTRPAAAGTTNAHVAVHGAGADGTGEKIGGSMGGMLHQPKWLRAASVVLLFSITALVVAVVILLNRGSFTSEAKFVNGNGYQAVFLNTDQVYFGHIVDLNNKYVNLMDVYYLSAKQTDTDKPAELQLNKLGCEVHGPNDQLIVNRDQVTFWENIKDDSTVVKGIKELAEKNKNGLTCPTNQTSEVSQQNLQQATGTEDN